ncbi:MAG: dihydroorotate dehydrogenase electron transfer subunit [Muribaculaceae bacterium]|nr:dihydroorotate dehydrogenase electron transfer subunit [Muribaculaceae bacterium]
MSKCICDFRLIQSYALPSGNRIMQFIPEGDCPECFPGQFIEVKIDHAPTALLRRPISVCHYSVRDGLTLLVKPQGPATSLFTELPLGSVVNMMLPLGHGFNTDIKPGEKVLLAGGGVGIAPLVMLCDCLAEKGATVHIALGGRSANDINGIPQLFPKAERVFASTNDGSAGTEGVVTDIPIFERLADYERVYCCGPTPMMKAVARIARASEVWCEVSLENHMACGLGACLCCVENINEAEGNVCVCTEGPVFNINRLTSWQ